MSSKHSDVLTSREAAKLLGVALSTVQYWTRNGVLQAWYTPGGHRRILRQSVEDLLNKRPQYGQSIHQVEKSAEEDKRLKVVLVEDQLVQRNMFEGHFRYRKLPVDLVMASNGFEGLIKIGESSPDVVIADLIMPGMDGFEMINALESMDELKRCKLIVATSLSFSEVNKRGGLPEHVAFFQKPVVFDQLANILLQYHAEKSGKGSKGVQQA